MSLVAIKRRAEGMVYEGEIYERLDLRSMKAFGAKFVKCAFRECKMDLSDLRNGRFEGCTFLHCDMQRVDFSTSSFASIIFEDCDLEQSSFSGCHLNDVDFKDCRMAYAETLFQGATAFSNVSFEKCNLHSSNLDFRQAEPGTLRFIESNLWGAKMAFGCAVWQAEFDEKTCQRFVAMVARVYPENDTRVKLMEIAGDQYAVVDRAMRETKR